MKRAWRILLMISGALTALAGQASSEVVRLEERQFLSGAGRITFSEVPMFSVNPVYPPALYGGGAGSPTVRFGGHFRGRRLGTSDQCPRDAPVTGCLVGTPVRPLALDHSAPQVMTLPNRARGAQPPELGGSPTYNGPIAIWFDQDVAAVGLRGGHFDGVGGVAITIYDRQGRMLGRTANRQLGFEFMGLATSDLSPRIAGLEFHLVGREPAGFGVDNIRFGAPRQIDLPGRRAPAAPPTPPAVPPTPQTAPTAPPGWVPIPP